MKNIFYISLVSLFALNIISCAKDEEHSSTSSTSNTSTDNTPELFITWGNSGTILTSSDNGTTWDNASTCASSCTGVTYGNGIFVVGSDSYLKTSSDGSTWNS